MPARPLPKYFHMSTPTYPQEKMFFKSILGHKPDQILRVEPIPYPSMHAISPIRARTRWRHGHIGVYSRPSSYSHAREPHLLNIRTTCFRHLVCGDDASLCQQSTYVERVLSLLATVWKFPQFSREDFSPYAVTTYDDFAHKTFSRPCLFPSPSE